MRPKSLNSIDRYVKGIVSEKKQGVPEGHSLLNIIDFIAYAEVCESVLSNSFRIVVLMFLLSGIDSFARRAML